MCGADEAACEAAVAAAAPLDTAIYAEAAAAFDARVAALGAPFAARLAAFRAARDAYAEPPERGRRWLDIKRGGGEVYAAQVPMNRLRCAFGASAAERHACAGLYADSPFRYNWRLRPAQCVRAAPRLPRDRGRGARRQGRRPAAPPPPPLRPLVSRSAAPSTAARMRPTRPTATRSAPTRRRRRWARPARGGGGDEWLC